MAEDTALTWKKRLSFMYMFFAWNAFGYVCFKIFSEDPQNKKNETSGGINIVYLLDIC